MKLRFFYVFAMCMTVLFSTSCTKDMEYKDVQVSPVTQLYEPTDGQSVTLVASSTASLFFEWAAAKAEDSGSPLASLHFYLFLLVLRVKVLARLFLIKKMVILQIRFIVLLLIITGFVIMQQ